MNVNQMRGFLKSRYPSSYTWGQKVDKMPDEQVIAIYTNPHITMPKNNGRTQAQQTFKTYMESDLIQNCRVDNPNKQSLLCNFQVEPLSPDYNICPHCGARLDLDEHCDCYESH